MSYIMITVIVCNLQKKTQDNANKNKEKRQARKLEQRRIADAMAHVTNANKLKDIASLCKELLVYRNNDLEVEMYIQRVTDLEKNVLQWAIDLTERNMKKLLVSNFINIYLIHKHIKLLIF